jgi:hypothetical protein
MGCFRYAVVRRLDERNPAISAGDPWLSGPASLRVWPFFIFLEEKEISLRKYKPRVSKKQETVGQISQSVILQLCIVS